MCPGGGERRHGPPGQLPGLPLAKRFRAVMVALALLALTLQVPDSAQFAAEAQRLLAAGRHAEMRWPALADVKAQAESLYQASAW